MPRTKNDRSSVRRSGAVVESLADSPTGQQIDGNIILQGATFVAPNIFIVGTGFGAGTVFVDGADTTAGFLDPKIANTSIVLNPAGNEQLLITPYSGVQEVNDASIVAVDTANIIVFSNLTANRSVTLPSLATLPVGFTFTVKDLSGDVNFIITILPNGTDKIDSLSQFQFGSGQNSIYEFIKTTSLGWIVK